MTDATARVRGSALDQRSKNHQGDHWHYELKHSRSISDQLIVELVKKLDNGQFDPDDEGGGYEYYVSDGIEVRGKRYKLIWLLEKNEIYIGVVNAYRRK